MGFFRGLYGFFLGMLVYRLHQTRNAPIPRASLLEVSAVVGVVFFVTFFGKSMLALAAPLIFAIVVYIFAFEAGILSRALKTRPLELLGRWSYSVYLGHYLLLLLFVAALRSLQKIFGMPLPAAEPLSLGNLYVADLLCLTYAALVIAISSRTFLWIEEPWRRRFNGWADILRPLRRSTPPTGIPRPSP
jgi:peptidoglycan/LPS O-acetylase OafA/YrhL